MISHRESFEHLNQSISRINEFVNISEYPIIIVGCKVEVEDKRKVLTEEGQQLAEKYNLTFFETSALTEKGVKEAFSTLIQKIYDRNKRNQYICSFILNSLSSKSYLFYLKKYKYHCFYC